MSAHLNSTGRAFPRWQMPPLDPPPAASPPTMTEELPEPVDPTAAKLAEAQAEAAQALAEQLAQGHAEGLARGLEEGKAAGHAAGYDEGHQAAHQQLAEQAQRLAAIVQSLTQPIPALDRVVEEAVVALALEIARCVIGGEVSRSREYLVRLIREAIGRVPIEMGAAQVVLNPADLELVRWLAPEIENAGTTFVGDESIEVGGCLVVANGDEASIKDRRWAPRAGEGGSQVNLTLSSRWRSVMLTLFDGEDE